MNRFIPAKYKRLLDVEDRIDQKNLPAYRSAVRSLYPKIKPHDLANFVNFSSKYLGATVNPQFAGFGSHENVASMVNGVRELSHRTGPQASQITEFMNAYQSMQPASSPEDE